MALFRLPLTFNKKISFWKLLGSGKSGSFDKNPDWQQWGIFVVIRPGETVPDTENPDFYRFIFGRGIAKWMKLFHCEAWTIVLEPVEGHGLWDRKAVFGALPSNLPFNGPIAILTRASIRLSRLRQFWRHVPAVSGKMSGAPGFLFSLGIGELPLVKQATFSIWRSVQDMKAFAYQDKDHLKVIQKTRKESWYSEEMFIRFAIIASLGTIRGKDPLAGKL